MARKRPMISLTNGKKHFCRLCKCDMVLQEKEFEMQPIRGTKSIKVKEEILYCPSCKQFYITQLMSQQLVRKYPGYYVNVSTYDPRSTKKWKTKEGHIAPPSASQVIQQKENDSLVNGLLHQSKPDNASSKGKTHVANRTSDPGLNAQVYLSNTFSSANNICPLCSSVLGKELVNIPVIEETGDFYRYYSETVQFCYRCLKAYISKDAVTSILAKVNSNTRTVRTIKLENAAIHRSDINREYLFRPTINNNYAIFFPGHDYRKGKTSTPAAMDLNAQSFLGKMGYTVSKSTSVRRHILLDAIKLYGKRKVSDHLAFMIATRKAQENGEKKYAHALRIWQEDINYISEI